MAADHDSTPRDLTAAALVEAAQRAAFATDAEGLVRAWNGAAQQLLGFSTSHAVGRHFDTLLGPRDVHDNPFLHGNLPLVELALQAEPVHPFEMSVRDSSGQRLIVQVGIVVVLAGDDEGHRVVYLLERRFRRRRSDEVIERLLSESKWRDAPAPSAESDLLTPRQREVLRLLAEGEGPQEIAETLSLSVFTVRSHLRAIYGRLGAHSQSEAVAKAYQLRLI